MRRSPIVIGLAKRSIASLAVIGAHCDDIAIGAGATLSQLTEQHPDVVVHALVLTGGGTEREVEEKDAFAALCGAAEVRLTVHDLPDGRLPQHWGEVKQRLADFRASCDPDLVLAPQRGNCHQDHRLLAELVPTEFRDHLVLGYEILKWESVLPNPTVYRPIEQATAMRRVQLLHECYPSQISRDWFDLETFFGSDGYLGCLLLGLIIRAWYNHPDLLAPQLTADGHDVVGLDTGYLRLRGVQCRSRYSLLTWCKAAPLPRAVQAWHRSLYSFYTPYHLCHFRGADYRGPRCSYRRRHGAGIAYPPRGGRHHWPRSTSKLARSSTGSAAITTTGRRRRPILLARSGCCRSVLPRDAYSSVTSPRTSACRRGGWWTN